MPQSPQQDDYLKKTLQESSTLTDAQRQAMWDVFHQAKDPSDFVSRINSTLPDMDDDAKQTLYDLRYNPSKYMDANGNPIPPGGKAASTQPAAPSQPPSMGPRPLPKLSLMQRGEAAITPNAALPALSWIQKHINAPLDNMGQAGSQMGGEAAKALIAAPISTIAAGARQQLGLPPTIEEGNDIATSMQQLEKQHPIVAGVTQGLGGIVGGTLADPRNWPFLLEGGAGGIKKGMSTINRLVSGGFSVQQIKGAIDTIPKIKDAIKNGQDEEAASLITQAVGGATMGSLAGAAAVSKAPPVGTKPSVDMAKTDTPTTAPHVPTEPVPIEVAPMPEAQSLAKSQSMSVSETAIPEMHPAEKAELEEQAGRSLSTADAQKLRVRNVQNEAVSQMLSGAKPTDIVEQIRNRNESTAEYQTRKAAEETAIRTQKSVEAVKPPLEAAAAEPIPAKLDVADDAITKQINATEKEKLPLLQQAFLERAQDHLLQAKIIRNLVELHTKNEATAKKLIEIKATGRPAYPVTTVGPSGEKVYVTDENGKTVFTKEEGEAGIHSRHFLAEMAGLKPRFNLDDMPIRPSPAKIPQEAWNKAIDITKNQYFELRNTIKTNMDIANSTGQDLDDTEIPSQLKELDRLGSKIWQIPKDISPAGRREQLPPPIDKNGNIVGEHPAWTMDLKTAQRLMGSKVKQMPSMDELLSKATERENLADFNVEAAKRVSDKLNGQRGAVGSSSLKRAVQPVLTDDVSTARGLAKLVKESGLTPIADTAIKRPHAAWMSEDGKVAVDADESLHITHSELAAELLKKFGHGDSPVSAYRILLDKGLIRKVNPFTFQVKRLTPTNLAAIDTELFRDGEWGKETNIEIGDFYSGDKIQYVHLDAGWDNEHGNVGEAIRAEIFRQSRLRGEKGFIGTGNLASASLGAAIGLHFGGLPGAAGGWGIGFITPELLRSPLMKSSIANMRSMLDAVKVPLSDWLRGTPQPDPILPRMRGIIDEQHKDIQGSHLGLIQRMAMLPNNIRRAFTDRLVILNDQQSHLTNFLLRIDPRGRMIRAGERPSLDDSPFITLYNLATDIRGAQAFNSIQYAKVLAEAKKAGLSTHLDEYLNLNAYNRVYQTLTEHAQSQADIITHSNNELKNPQLQPRDRIQLEDNIVEARKNLTDTLERMQSGKVVPGNYTLTKIHADLDTLQQTLGPIKFQMVQDFARRVYSRNRAALDLLHDHGVVSDANYKLFTSRGDEYIPMTRIMNDLAGNEGRWSGAASPAFLRKQNVIHSLEGSERTNRSPMVASMSFNDEAISEALRNRAIGEYIQAAIDHPDVHGTNFTRVGPDYKAKEGEMLVGHYVDGKPTTYAVPKEIGTTLQGASPLVNDIVGGAMARTVLNMAKAGATTLNLGFSTMRVATDLSRLAVLSEAGVKLSTFPKDLASIGKLWMQSLHETITRSSAWEEAIRQGYTFSGAQRNITPEAFLPAQKLGYTGRINPVRILNGIADINAAIEDSIKMTAYKRLKLQGYSDKAAIYETKRFGGAPDYSRKGDLSPVANLALMFFNADIQHITQAFSRVAENPKRMIPILAASTAAVMMLAQHNWSQKDENGQPLMRRVPYEIRDRDFVFLTGETKQTNTGATVPVMWRMRKPDFASLFINPVENLMNKIMGREDRTGTQLAIDALQHATPFTGAPIQPNAPISSGAKAVIASANPLIRTPIEELLNQRMYGSGGPIVTKPNVEPQYQFGPSTSPVAIAAGRATGISPQRIEHIAQSLTGGASNVAFSALSPLFPKPGTTNMIPGSPEARRQTPGVGPIEGRFRETAVDQQEQNLTTKFYNNINAATVHYNTFESLLKSDPTSAFAYQKQNPDAVWKGRMASLMAKRIAEIDQIQRMTESNKSIDEKTREQTLKNIHDTKMRILDSFNGIFDRTVANRTGVSTMGTTAK